MQFKTAAIIFLGIIGFAPLSFPSSLCIQPIRAGMSIAFAIESDSGCCLIDAGSPGKEKTILDQLSRFSTKPLKLIILTHAHFDHFGSAGKLRELTGARIAIHENDSADLKAGVTRIDKPRGWGMLGKPLLPAANAILHTTPVTPDVILHDGESLDSFGLPATVILTPGHTPGSISILFTDSTAIVGDLTVTHPWPQSQCYYACDWNVQNASLVKMQQINPARVYSGHSVKPVSREGFLEFKPVK